MTQEQDPAKIIVILTVMIYLMSDELAKLSGLTSSQKIRDDYRDLARKNISGKTVAELEEYLKQFN